MKTLLTTALTVLTLVIGGCGKEEASRDTAGPPAEKTTHTEGDGHDHGETDHPSDHEGDDHAGHEH